MFIAVLQFMTSGLPLLVAAAGTGAGLGSLGFHCFPNWVGSGLSQHLSFPPFPALPPLIHLTPGRPPWNSQTRWISIPRPWGFARALLGWGRSWICCSWCGTAGSGWCARKLGRLPSRLLCIACLNEPRRGPASCLRVGGIGPRVLSAVLRKLVKQGPKV